MLNYQSKHVMMQVMHGEQVAKLVEHEEEMEIGGTSRTGGDVGGTRRTRGGVGGTQTPRRR